MRIFVGVPRGGGVKRQWGCRRQQFLAFLVAISSETLDRISRIYIYIQDMRPSSAFQWSQMHDLEWPWMYYFTLNNEDDRNWEWLCDVLVCVKYAIWQIAYLTDGAICLLFSAEEFSVVICFAKFLQQKHSLGNKHHLYCIQVENDRGRRRLRQLDTFWWK